jgi:hypothetical protein
MAAHGSFGKEGASIEDGLFRAIGGVLVVARNVSPDVEISALARGVRT